MIQFLEDMKGVKNKALTSSEREELDSLRRDHQRLKAKAGKEKNEDESSDSGEEKKGDHSSDDVRSIYNIVAE